MTTMTSVTTTEEDDGVQLIVNETTAMISRQIEVDGIRSVVGFVTGPDGGVARVGIGHRQPLFSFKMDHLYASEQSCPTCRGNGTADDSMSWSRRNPIVRFTSNGLEIHHVGE
jgi:hypothetical protein